ncbi:hypothetical protein GGE67_005962 [Rhizobium leucaenae]|uniref:Uncharacterized protein n=1 Tax=Rhizobium lusitanum TaxID=293958 RepID=A0A1C3X8R2_9HYPH|nr:hypothetical protein [Rhizobium leucaenae]MBB6489601.1 hypothetical protein [Rhizobium lusitanum]SCB48589.1 hypothetical protein GA0061101_12838 [Rhizobium lusitanum]
MPEELLQEVSCDSARTPTNKANMGKVMARKVKWFDANKKYGFIKLTMVARIFSCISVKL